MISAILLAHGTTLSARTTLTVPRCLTSLIDACVQGVITDAILVGPGGQLLDRIADDAGCSYIESHDPTQGVREALKLSRNDHVLLLSTNYAVDQSFSEEARDIFANNYRQQAFILRSAPNTLITRLLPRSAAPAGIVAPKEILRSTHYILDIAHLSRKLSSSDFLTRARRLN